MTTLSKEDVVRWEAEADKFKTGEFTDTLDLKSFATLARADLVAENERLKDTADRWCEKANEAANQFVDFVHGEHSRLATERDELRDQLTATRTELAAAEARETKLRAAIDVVLSDAEECEDHEGWLANLVSCEAIHQLDEAFIQPRDDSALREMIAGVYEECAKVPDNVPIRVGNAGIWGVDVKNAIRALAEKARHGN